MEEHRLGPYAEEPPPPGLRRWLRRLWRYATPRDGPDPGHRVLPVTAPSLAFSWRVSPDGRVEDPALELVGPVHTPRSFRPGAGTVMEALQVRPQWCPALLGVAGWEHVDALRPGSAVGIPGADELFGEALAEVESGGSALPALLRWAGRRAGALRQGSAEWLAHAALARLQGSGGGRLRVGEVARELGVSPRHLRRSVRGLTGSSPKFLQRVARLNALLAEADRTPAPSWSGLAAGLGYADQPHLIQEVRQLTGRTPVALHRERRREHVRFLQSSSGDRA